VLMARGQEHCTRVDAVALQTAKWRCCTGDHEYYFAIADE
jgi:hypothetical protein